MRYTLQDLEGEFSKVKRDTRTALTPFHEQLHPRTQRLEDIRYLLSSGHDVQAIEVNDIELLFDVEGNVPDDAEVSLTGIRTDNYLMTALHGIDNNIILKPGKAFCPSYYDVSPLIPCGSRWHSMGWSMCRAR